MLTTTGALPASAPVVAMFAPAMPTDEALLADLRRESRHAFAGLYPRYAGLVRQFVLRNHGSLTEADDLFQDTLLVLVQQLRRDNFQLTASLKTYLLAIAKHLWLQRLRVAGRTTPLPAVLSEQLHDDLTLAIEHETTYLDRLQGYIRRLTAHCQHLIQEMFFDNKTIEAIQQEHGYSSRHNALNQKHKCVEQLRRRAGQAG